MSLPAIPDTFRWTQQPWGPALRCRPLEAIAPHLFTTRQLALSSPSDWQRAAEAVGAREAATLTQVHGRDVVVRRRGSREGPPHNDSEAQRFSARTPQRPEGDVLVSNDPDIALAVRAADCVPLLMADPRTGAVAAVHAGWRGTAAGAAAAAVDALAREFGARPEDLVAAIGPSIGACCYEVGHELVDAFAAAGHSRDRIERWFITPAHAAKPRLDTWAANRDQLISAGVAADNIHVSGVCTASNLDLFPSFRKEQDAAGRMAGLIRSRG